MLKFNDEPVSVEMASAVLTDGTVIKWEGELAVGTAIVVETAEGDIPAPDATHEVEGGTLVTIEGSNLGLKEDDVKGKIRIGDIPCELIDYQVSVKIICRTGSAPTEIDAPVIIGNTAGYTESTVKYSYKVRIFFPLVVS